MNNFDVLNLIVFKRLILKHKITIPHLFYKFLTYYDDLDKYIYNTKIIGRRDVDFLKSYLTRSNADSLIMDFFGWNASLEGTKYWSHLHDIWEEIVCMYNDVQ